MRSIGIDVGGTFTDVVMVDGNGAGIWSAKVPTTPEDPAQGAIDGVRRVLDLSSASAAEVTFVGHGTTIATNLVVEGKAAPAALVATAGFGDLLEIRRSARHDRADLYDLHFTNPPPLVPRRFRFEARERILFDGEVAEPLGDDEIDRLIELVAASPVEAVAVCFLHAHVSPDHEKRFIEALRRRLPKKFASASHEVNPEIFEYERTSTTVVNAMLGPKCADYVRTFEARLADIGIGGVTRFMQSNGGLTSPSVIANRPINLLQSGPAGGVTAALKLCRSLGIPNAILGDVGGTTFDVSLIRGGEPEVRNGATIQTYVVRAPTIDIESVGAGGGSIAWIDEAGGVHVGPQSAGARPGPVCYGRGGELPTLTDCNLILGYLDPDSFPDDIPLDLEAACRAVEKHVAAPLGCGVVEAAAIVRAIANANMAQAIRLMTVQRGYDPREFAYVCFGGAGPVHAADLARDLDIPTIIVPSLPGLFSAVGMLVADEVHEVQAPIGRTLGDLAASDVRAAFAELEAKARALFPETGTEIEFRYRADCRYLNQAEPITIDVPMPLDEVDRQMRTVFDAEHRRHWNFVRDELPIVLVNLRLTATARTGIDFKADLPAQQGEPAAPYRRRRLYANGRWIEVPTYRRQSIRPGDVVIGPGVIEEQSSSLFFDEGRVSVDASGTLRLDRRG